MGNLKNLLAPMHRLLGLQGLRGLMALLAFVLFQLGSAPLAQAQTQSSDFDHASTGFVLNGLHQSARCETCHVKGVFKGTPKDCASCHGWNNPRAATVMPTNHIPTANISCETCHMASLSQFVDATNTFSHTLVQSLSCQSCHASNHPHPNVKTNPKDCHPPGHPEPEHVVRPVPHHTAVHRPQDPHQPHPHGQGVVFGLPHQHRLRGGSQHAGHSRLCALGQRQLPALP
ncbi:hypothetical protein DIC66_18645 [Rhodoferax lacus]|uniref:Uncharacterized protein n=1 Tax=Rhodoferax lacus TaxID=2184758 RepID=A0A3E1R8L6_9BURK|nr:hypothetical protein [Rhodoferax lacus]RFO95382.1 hypothetical protein DIC66_18645 [Rhodoferax lacus]